MNSINMETIKNWISQCIDKFSNQKEYTKDIIEYVYASVTSINQDDDLSKKLPSHIMDQLGWFLQEIKWVFWWFVIPQIEKDNNLSPEFIHQICTQIEIRLYHKLDDFTGGLDDSFITALSGAKYESERTSDQQIVLIPSKQIMEDNISEEGVAYFSSDAHLELNNRSVSAVRKQLNMAKENAALAIYKNHENGNFYTAGLLPADIVQKYPRFEMVGQMEWKFCVPVQDDKDGCRLRYKNGSLMLPIFDIEEFVRAKLLQFFPYRVIKNVDLDKVIKLIVGTRICNHGAVLIISDTDTLKGELERLVAEGKRGIRFQEPINILVEDNKKELYLLHRYASIDGALFVDDHGYCYSSGVILDGILKYEGDRNRGARYNSTKTYVENQYAEEEKFLIGIVKSEDGMLDLFRGIPWVQQEKNT